MFINLRSSTGKSRIWTSCHQLQFHWLREGSEFHKANLFTIPKKCNSDLIQGFWVAEALYFGEPSTIVARTITWTFHLQMYTKKNSSANIDIVIQRPEFMSFWIDSHINHTFPSQVGGKRFFRLPQINRIWYILVSFFSTQISPEHGSCH